VFGWLEPVRAWLAGDGALILPQIQLAIFALGILLTDFWLEEDQKAWNGWTALAGVGFSAYSLVKLYDALQRAKQETGDAAIAGFNGTILVDPFFVFFGFLFLAATALVILLSMRYLEIEGEHHGEYYALLLFAAIGMMFMASGIDLVVLFLGLETMAITFYILAGFLRHNKKSNEGALKYMLLGAFSSGLLAYGFSLLYGMSGSTQLPAILRGVAQAEAGNVLVTFSLVTVLAGMLFKVAAVPFHQWAPDTYEGAPTSITAYLSTASKAASFAMLLRILLTVFWPVRMDWGAMLAGVAIATMTWGNFAALTQSNLKRMLAYSSIAHAGYILLGLVAYAANPASQTGLRGIAFYLLSYIFMNTGAFAIIIMLRRKGLIGDEIEDVQGLYYRNPAAAVALLLFMLSLAGLPPTAGFLGKYFIFLALIEAKYYTLAVLAVLYVVPALYYYFRIVSSAWMRDSNDPLAPVFSWAQALAVAAAALVTLVAGIYPEPFIRIASYSLFYLGR